LNEELTLFRDREHVTVHIKIVSTTSWAFTSTVPIDQMIFSARLVFRNSNLAVIIRSTENLKLTDTDIDVGSCTTGTTTDDQNTLFNNRNFVGEDEIVVYLVRSVLLSGTSNLNGCASYPAAKPGATVASITWMLAHQIGNLTKAE